MKKLFTYILIIFSVLSCREKEVLPQIEPASISFSSPGVVQTKSVLIEDKSQLEIGSGQLGYSVFAARYIPSATGAITRHEQFMNNVLVSSSNSGLTWSYDADPDQEGVQQLYWSPGAVHKFFAVYPYYEVEDGDNSTNNDIYDLGLTYAINEQAHALQVTGKHPVTGASLIDVDPGAIDPSVTKLICTGIDNADKNLCPDILYGVKLYSDPYSVSENRAPVKFTLNHALSAVSFRIRNASEYKIDGVETQNITGFKNASEYVQLSDDGPVWGPLYTVTEHTFKVPNITSPVESGQYYPTSGSEYWYTALLIPQNFGNQATSPSFSFTVSFDSASAKTYTINFKDYQVHSNAEHAFSFLPGYRYVYNINVTSSVISCHVDVVPWIEDEPIELN
jgi:hypothetical protein